MQFDHSTRVVLSVFRTKRNRGTLLAILEPPGIYR